MSLIARGLIRAVICGPSCETWSIARYRTLHSESGKVIKGPRPLRSIDESYGISGLTSAEYQQMEVGNGFLFVALETFIATHRYGGMRLD